MKIVTAPPSDTKPFRGFLKWVGGKKRLAPILASLMPPSIGSYYEPMAGSAALFFWLRSNAYQASKFTLNDVNRELMQTFEAVRDAPEDIIQILDLDGFKDTSEEMYLKIRDIDPDTLSLPGVAARMIYLNRLCYNGLYRVNRSGKFNAPYGRYENPRVCNPDAIKTASGYLKSVRLLNRSYESILDSVRAGDFVYFDPPYVPVSTTSNFVNFTRSGFSKIDHEALASLVAELNRKNVQVLLSNSDTPLTRLLYKAYRIRTVGVPRSVNSVGEGRGPVDEIVVSNYE
jgi:DNA adenine methylase